MTSRYRIYIANQLVGYAWVSGNHPHFPNCKVGTLVPLHRQGTWEQGDLEIIFRNNITDIFPLEWDDERIVRDLANRVWPNTPITIQQIND